MASYLRPEINVQSDDPAVMDQAEEIVDDRTDLRAAAVRLMGWVHQSVRKKPVISVPSALDVLETRMGDCNEHSVLLTALLRAAGIPSRTCVGLVFSRGSFFYHAWNECYLGDWVSMDATLNQMPSDATHVKLAQGGLDQQAEIIALMGNLELEVLDYAYD
jgi:transglutaminase-like putative cysteine protease